MFCRTSGVLSVSVRNVCSLKDNDLGFDIMPLNLVIQMQSIKFKVSTAYFHEFTDSLIVALKLICPQANGRSQ